MEAAPAPLGWATVGQYTIPRRGLFYSNKGAE